MTRLFFCNPRDSVFDIAKKSLTWHVKIPCAEIQENRGFLGLHGFHLARQRAKTRHFIDFYFDMACHDFAFVSS